MPKLIKFLLPFLVLLAIIAYSLNLKKNLETNSALNEATSFNSILKELPKFTVYDLSGKAVESGNFNNQAKAYYVHIWGTWCGPCEAEFGDILTFAGKVKASQVKFYLIAVNDEVASIQKFIKRYKIIPENVIILKDKNNQVMDKFGTYKVPETFLFDSTNNSQGKYSGPQEWNKEIYFTQLNKFI